MILTKHESQIETIGVNEEIKFRIDAGSEEAVIQALIDMYKDPIGTTVREIASNIADAVKEKKLFAERNPGHELLQYFDPEDMGKVYITREDAFLGTQCSIVFKDRGIGMSEDRVKQVFTVFGASTKNNNNDLIGGYGLGAKSPLSYTDTMYVRTVYCGTEYIYVITRSGGNITCNKISENLIPEYNGTEVIIPIKNYYDLGKFEDAIDKQLCYFEMIEGIEAPESDYEDEHFIFRKRGEMNIRIGQVLYPFDHSLNNVDSRLWTLPITLKFNIGELDLIPSREGLRYSPRTIAAIKEKIEHVEEAGKKLAEDKYKNVDDLEVLFELNSDSESNAYVKFLKHYATDSMHFNGMSVRSIKSFIQDNFDVANYLLKPIIQGRGRRGNSTKVVSKYAALVCERDWNTNVTSLTRVYVGNRDFLSVGFDKVAKALEQIDNGRGFCIIESKDLPGTTAKKIESWLEQSSMLKFEDLEKLWQKTDEEWEQKRQDEIAAKRAARGKVVKRNLKKLGKFTAMILADSESARGIVAKPKVMEYESLTQMEAYYARKGDGARNWIRAKEDARSKAIIIEASEAQIKIMQELGVREWKCIYTEQSDMMDRIYSQVEVNVFLNRWGCLFFQWPHLQETFGFFNSEIHRLAGEIYSFKQRMNHKDFLKEEFKKVTVPLGIQEIQTKLKTLKSYVKGIEVLPALHESGHYEKEELKAIIYRLLNMNKKEYTKPEVQLSLPLE